MVVIRHNIYDLEKEVSANIDVKNINSDTDTQDAGNYGAAVDIGTTTISLSLFSLSNKKHMTNITETNLQTKYGTDVMMRIMHANMGKAFMLHKIVIRQIEDMLDNASSGICEAKDIKELTVTGNTTMCHLFLDKDLSQMTGAPFITAYKGSVSTYGKDTGFKKYSHLSIYVMSGVTAHIGADAVSMLCAKRLYAQDKIQLAIDIGTNAEILLNNKGEIYACSAAAGPAFEGKGTKCGIRAGNGAVNGVKISKFTGNIVLDVIDSDAKGTRQNETALKGICGSGLVDAVAELLKIGVLNQSGYLMEYSEALKNKVCADIAERLKKDDEGNFFAFCNNIFVTQKDIRSIQLAKAAVQAGTEILLKKAGICICDIDEIKIAGVFGKFIHPKSATVIGLYPDICKDRMEFVGNAAGNGAAMALLDDNFKELTERYAKSIKHVELADEDEFKSKFLSAMAFKKW